MKLYRGKIAFDEPYRPRADAGTGKRNDLEWHRIWKRAWREKNLEHVRRYQREYKRKYRKRMKLEC